MEKEINIAALLEGKPEGTKLYDIFRNIEVTLYCIEKEGDKTNIFCGKDGFMPAYSDSGRDAVFRSGMQILKPSKAMQDWSKFAWKKGDVLLYTDGKSLHYTIFEAFQDDEYTAFESRYTSWGGNHWIQFDDQNPTKFFTKAPDEKAKAFIEKVEAHYGGKLNMETLEIDKEQVGNQPKKCELKPFDKVLVRDTNDDIWTPILFAEYDKNCTNDYLYGVISSGCGIVYYKQCIPYNEQTKHLLGTIDEWKGGE